jgi:peptide alpha-N-acetyltransferase
MIPLFPLLHTLLPSQYPRSSACKRIPLDLMPPDRPSGFTSALDAYVRPYLRKGVPSLFVDIAPLCR